MPKKELAINCSEVSKIYKQYRNQLNRLLDDLNISFLNQKHESDLKIFKALKEISFEVKKGERVGLIGRNGSGKTTLLKLICRSIQPSSGQIKINGEVQALLNIGLGFDPELTGLENVENSMQYNALSKEDYKKAKEDILKFIEMDDFIDQPFKTYSMGMQSRLMFATSTALKPDILIIDEALGAGDAYFMAKSKRRIDKLFDTGCTLLLVSHSMGQILEFCQKAIWLEKGEIIMQGDAMDVVKEYEKFLHKPINKIMNNDDDDDEPSNFNELLKDSKKRIYQPIYNRKIFRYEEDFISQEPSFYPLRYKLPDNEKDSTDKFDYLVNDGLSRWDSGLEGLKFCGFSISDFKNRTNDLFSLEPMKFIISIECTKMGNYECRYGIIINDYQGNIICRIWSVIDKFSLNKGDTRQFAVIFNPLQLGEGEYLIGLCCNKADDLPSPTAKHTSDDRYDLINKSFSMNVKSKAKIELINASFYHPTEWYFPPKN